MCANGPCLPLHRSAGAMSACPYSLHSIAGAATAATAADLQQLMLGLTSSIGVRLPPTARCCTTARAMASSANTLSTIMQASVPCRMEGSLMQCLRCHLRPIHEMLRLLCALPCKAHTAAAATNPSAALTHADHLRSFIAVLIESGVRTPYIRTAARVWKHRCKRVQGLLTGGVARRDCVPVQKAQQQAWSGHFPACCQCSKWAASAAPSKCTTHLTCRHADQGPKDQHQGAHDAADGWDDARVPLVEGQPPRRPSILEPVGGAGCTRGNKMRQLLQMQSREPHRARSGCRYAPFGCCHRSSALPLQARPSCCGPHQSDSTAASADVQADMPAVMNTVDAAITLRSWLTRKMLRSRKPRNLPARGGSRVGKDAAVAVN